MCAVVVAFIGYTAYGSAGTVPWRPWDVVYLVFAGVAEIAFIATAWFATQPQLPEKRYLSVHRARMAFLAGAACAMLSIIVFLVPDFFQHRG